LHRLDSPIEIRNSLEYTTLIFLLATRQSHSKSHQNDGSPRTRQKQPSSKRQHAAYSTHLGGSELISRAGWLAPPLTPTATPSRLL
jgi:hypothetical protein